MHWTHKYYRKMIDDIENFSGTAAFNFINQAVYGMFGTAAWANPRHIFWFNNYGQRDMHPKAGGVTYHWGPNYGVAVYLLVNTIAVVRRLSSVTGEWFSTCRSALASPGRAACFSNSVAPATISSSPLSLVFAVRDAAKSSMVVYVME